MNTITLNAFPLALSEYEVTARVIPYTQEQFDDLKDNMGVNQAIRRYREEILVFSSDGSYPLAGEVKSFDLKKNPGLFCFLAKDGIRRHFLSIGRKLLGFYPMELLSRREEHELLHPIIGGDYPFQIVVRYTLDTRMIRGIPHLVIDCSTRRKVTKTCQFFLDKDFDLDNRYVAVEQSDGKRKLIGHISEVGDGILNVIGFDGNNQTIATDEVYLEPSIRNIDDYIQHSHGAYRDNIVEKIRVAISRFNGGKNKMEMINSLKKYFQSNHLDLIDGTGLYINDAPEVQGMCGYLDKPVFVFNDSGEANWVEKGIARHGPYTKRTFDRNDPSVCVICFKRDKGVVEQFVRKLLRGIPGSKYFRLGLEGKFDIGTSRVKVFTIDTDDFDGYRSVILKVLNEKADEGERWDLALVQVKQSFKDLYVTYNPYYCSKHLFLMHKVPVQCFTTELLHHDDYSLGYSLNNMALACYAKMGGIPWLLKCSPTLSHELVIGIGSANIGEGRGVMQRVMGITTIFTGDGSYIVSNTTKAVSPEAYCNALSELLDDTIEKISKRMNWQKGDTIRLVFHASVKKFNRDEIQAVTSVINKFSDYQVEYAFVKVSDHHGLHMFDSSTMNCSKGKYAPRRGRKFKLSHYENLIYLTGQQQLRTATHGHPRGVILSIHRDSTFKDLRYLSSQLFNFSSHSWRSYFPNPMPVTISYSDLIARNLGWLNRLPAWDDSILIGKIGQTQWFL